jgi:hypothetical protein
VSRYAVAGKDAVTACGSGRRTVVGARWHGKPAALAMPGGVSP